eukprot:TRINITY_DN3778_c0_g1_i2.p1 TRINITY_DN3778_c0_g1~~TRINITY_DN3778_c0_g1_i2.p1  ORF type:complete len:135 (+),score=49.07 TRINITY_DN3778_c0_g1_i2:328-732(+)
MVWAPMVVILACTISGMGSIKTEVHDGFNRAEVQLHQLIRDFKQQQQQQQQNTQAKAEVNAELARVQLDNNKLIRQLQDQQAKHKSLGLELYMLRQQLNQQQPQHTVKESEHAPPQQQEAEQQGAQTEKMEGEH